MEEKNYSALIIEFVKSKKYSLDERNKIQEAVYDYTKLLNHMFRSNIKYDVQFGRGEELQGLFTTPWVAYLYCRFLKILVSSFIRAEIRERENIRLRAGIGFGAWDSQIILDANTTEEDSQAYRLARKAIDMVNSSPGHAVLFCSEDSFSDQMINAALHGATTLEETMSFGQQDMYNLVEAFYPVDANSAIDMDFFNKNFYIEQHTETNYNVIHAKQIESLKDEEGSYISAGTGKWGIATKLSYLVETSVQNVSRQLSEGKVFEARNACIASIRLMHFMLGKKIASPEAEDNNAETIR